MEDFANTFVTEEVILDETALQSVDEDDFDPFQIGVAFTDKVKKKSTETSPSSKGKSVSITTDYDYTATSDHKSIISASGSTIKSSASSSALPPRLMVKFKAHEEVSSMSHLSDDNVVGSSNVQIEGTVLVSYVI